MDKLVFSLIVATLLARPLGAQQEPRPACLDTAQTQRAMNVCAGNALRTADSLLARLLVDLHRALPPAEMVQLDSTQTTWSTYVSLQCRLANADNQDGSAYPMLISLCRGTYTVARIRELAPLFCGRTQLYAGSCPAADEYLDRADMEKAVH
jgi:uncharacterized protein YecT (DUF1311 family)